MPLGKCSKECKTHGEPWGGAFLRWNHDGTVVIETWAVYGPWPKAWGLQGNLADIMDEDVVSEEGVNVEVRA